MEKENEAKEQKKEEGSEKEETEDAVEEIEDKAEPMEEEEVEEGVEGVEGEEELPAVEEEVEPLPREEEEIVEERFYTIPLGKAWIAPSKKRVPRAIRLIKHFVKRHMKLEPPGALVEEEPRRIIITNEVNERVWRRGIKKPPRKIRVRTARDVEGNITVYLAEGD